MPRTIQVASNVRIVRRRCHVGHVSTLEVAFASGPHAAPGAFREVQSLTATEKAFVHYIALTTPLDMSDDPIIVEQGSPEALAAPKCCAPSARLYLYESDRARMAEAMKVSAMVMRQLQARGPSPVAEQIAHQRFALMYVTENAITPEEFAHAIELVVLPDGAPLPPCGRFELIDKRHGAEASDHAGLH